MCVFRSKEIYTFNVKLLLNFPKNTEKSDRFRCPVVWISYFSVSLCKMLYFSNRSSRWIIFSDSRVCFELGKLHFCHFHPELGIIYRTNFIWKHFVHTRTIQRMFHQEFNRFKSSLTVLPYSICEWCELIVCVLVLCDRLMYKEQKTHTHKQTEGPLCVYEQKQNRQKHKTVHSDGTSASQTSECPHLKEQW